MNTMDLLNKYAELTETWMEKEAKVDAYIENWLDEKIDASLEQMEQFVNNERQQIEQLKKLSEQVQAEYLRIKQEEAMRKHANNVVRKEFGTTPDEIIITGGVLSSNPRESHLIGRSKTQEELLQEKEQFLNTIKSRAISKEITLAEASKLSHEVKIAYDMQIGELLENTQSGMNR